MSQSLLIARRELYAYLRSPLGSVIVAASLVADGLAFYWYGLSQRLMSQQCLQQFFWVASAPTMIASILLCMRLLSEERQMGTATLLNTAPVRDAEIVLGKFIAGFGAVAFLTLLTLYMPLLVAVHGKVSVGHIVVGYVGLLLLGAAVSAISLFASALANSQVVAAILSAIFVAVLLLLWTVARAVDPPLNKVLSGLALHHENFRPFMQGTLELRTVAYYVMTTYFFLVCSTKVLEARRWR